MAIESRKVVLQEAERIVCSDRNQQYGEPEDNFGVIADYWNCYLGMDRRLTAKDVAIMMTLFKIGRMQTAKVEKVDTYIDAIGYIACAADTAKVVIE